MKLSRTIAWTTWATASTFYAFQYILRVMPNIMLDDIMRHYAINAGTMGQFSGVYYIGYSLLHIPIGIMLDRFGPKKIMAGCILATVLGMLPLAFASNWVYPTLGRILVGMGSSGAILGIFKIIRMTFSEKRFARMLSFSVTIGLIGAIYGGGPVDYMKNIFGFQKVVLFFAAVGIVLALITYFIIPTTEISNKSSVISDVKEVMGNRRVLLACVSAGLMVGPLEGFADVWGTVFFKQVQGFDGLLAASLPSMIFVGMCFGSPVLNYIGEKTGSYLGAVIGSGLIMALGFLFLLSGKLSPEIISIGFVMIGICCAYQILAIYKVSTYVRKDVAGLATGVANMIIMIFGYVFHGAIGVVINTFGGVHSSSALVYGVSVIPVALFIGVIGFTFLFLKEKSKKALAEN